MECRSEFANALIVRDFLADDFVTPRAFGSIFRDYR